MTTSSPSDMPLFWNEILSQELLRFLTGRLKCPESAADLTQETFLRLQQFIQSTPPNNARALAFSIAVNLATDYQRKMKFRQKVMVDEEFEHCRHSGYQSLSDVGPERIVTTQQQLQLVNAALEELPMDCRNAFMLHSINGLTQAQIASRLGLTQVKVSRLLLKAMGHCQNRLNAQNEAKINH